MISADGTRHHPRAAPPSGRTIVRLRGALDIDATPALRERLNDVLRRSAELVVLDLSHVLSCDASGLAVLIGTQRRARLLGIKVRLAAPTPAVAKLLRSTGLDHSFTIYADLSPALASPRYEPARPVPPAIPALPLPALPLPAAAGRRRPSPQAEPSAGEFRQQDFPVTKGSLPFLSRPSVNALA